MKKGYQHGGLRQKYIITKVSGKPTDPDAKYFVLRYDEDPHAVRALMTYIRSIEIENPELAADLIDELEEGSSRWPSLKPVEGLGLNDQATFLLMGPRKRKDQK